MNWYMDVIRKYADFSGRARRKEFWMFALINLIISFVLGVLDNVFGTVIGQAGIGILGGLYSLAILVPGMAVFVRRLHDTGRSGWWFWIILIPLIGAIVLLVFEVSDSQPGENQYGPNPKMMG